METVFRLRYAAYCVEKGFLDPACYPDGLEFDHYDEQATHLVVTGAGYEPIGYMRVIEGRNSDSLPLFDHGLRSFEDSLVPRIEDTLEISRMIVRSDYRHVTRTVSDGFVPDADLPAPHAKNASDLIQLKLLRLTYRHAFENDIEWVYAAMEPTLHRKFRMFGMPFKQVGPPGEYYGEVRPYVMDVREMEHVLASRFPDKWEFFADGSPDPDAKVISPRGWNIPQIQHA